MPVGLWYVITFFAGLFIGRYWDILKKVVEQVRKDITRAHKETQKTLR